MVMAMIFASCGGDDNPMPQPMPLETCVGVVQDASIINDFECQKNIKLAGTALSVVVNPDKSGVNITDSVGRYLDNGTDAWDNIVVDFGSAIDLSEKGELTFQLWSTKEVPLLAKLEGGTAIEIATEVKGANKWFNYRFDFTRASGDSNTKLVVFVNAGQTDGTSEDEYFIDNIRWQEPSGPDCEGVDIDPAVINDFECQRNVALGEVVQNPFKEGINVTDSVAKYVDNGTDAWDNINIDFGEPIDLSTNNVLKIKIYSTKEVPLLAKLEGGTSPSFEVGSCCDGENNIDVTDEWKEYTFDFSSQASESHSKLVLFFNAGNTNGTEEDIYYVDDVRFVPSEQ